MPSLTSRRGKRYVDRADVAFVEFLEARQLLSAGSIDTTFGHGGSIATANTGTLNDSAVQADGKIVVVTSPNASQTHDSGVARRYNSNGTLDTTFGQSGVVQLQYSGTQFTGSLNAAEKVTVLSDGKILIVGTETDHLLLTRLNANGSFDTTFANGSTPIKGVIASPFIGVTVTSMTVLPNQKILVAGSALDSQFNQRWALSQFNANGSLDSTFGVKGHVLTSLGGTFPTINAIAVQSNGSIVAAGNTDNDQTGDVPVVARYTATGALDKTFGNQGIAYPAIASDGLFVSVALQSNGQIVLGAVGTPTATGNFIGLVTRLNANGTIDTHFGKSGVVDLPNIAGLSSIAIQKNGEILVAGGTDFTTGVVRLTRLTTSGTVDTLFGTKGVATTQFGSKDVASQPKILLTSTGRILLVGATYHSTSAGSTNGVGMTRFNET